MNNQGDVRTQPLKATKQYLKKLRASKKEVVRMLARATKQTLATREEKQAGLATGFYGLIERRVTEEDREACRRMLTYCDSEIKRVESELEIDPNATINK